VMWWTKNKETKSLWERERERERIRYTKLVLPILQMLWKFSRS